MPTYYPIFLDVRNRRCVVIGGGEVAERKTRSLLECEAQVTVISPQVTPGLHGLAQKGRITWHQRKFITGDLVGCFLAIAATDDSRVNRRIAAEASRLNVLLNVADVPSLCNFIAPSVIKRGEVTLAVSTGGASPALARKFREELSRSRVLEYADLAPLLSQARQELRKRGVEVNPERWQECINEELLDTVQRGGQKEALERLMKDLLRGCLEERAER